MNHIVARQAEPRIDASGPIRSPDSVGVMSRRFDYGFELRAGRLTYSDDVRLDGPIPQGVRLGVMKSGELTGQVHRRDAFTMSGPQAFLLVNANSPADGHVNIASGVPVHFVSVTMSLDDCESCGLPLDHLVKQAEGEAPARFRFGAPDTPLMTLVQQINCCPLQGPVRDMFLAGKALELAALIAGQFCETADPATVCPYLRHRPLPTRDLKKVYEARDRLLASLNEPPTLQDLARHVGLNVKKLTEGFRLAFGKSVFEILQEERLTLAYALLSAGDLTVGQVAHRVGYTAPHFSTLFRKKYGVTPRMFR